MNWISVKERLPDEGMTILVSDCQAVEIQEFYASGFTPVTYMEYEQDNAISPPHWMPLPEPPK